MNPALTLLDKVGLLAGQPLGGTPDSCATQGGGRTCIDGGQAALVTLSSEGTVGFALPQRAEDGLQFWRRGCFGTQAAGESAMVTSHDATARARAVQLLGTRGDRAALRMLRLAAFGQVYMVTRHEPETGTGWICYQLHPRQSLKYVLCDLGVAAAWPALRGRFSVLLSRPVTEHLRPWSIAVETATGDLRIGTTAWARLPETPQKAAAFDAVMRGMDQQGETAAAVYSLLSRHACAAPRPGRAGVAAEFDLHDTTIAAARFTLRLNRNDHP